MADIVFNIAKGRVAELYNRVDSNDPANSALVIVPVDVAAVTDATLRDFDTLAAITATTSEPSGVIGQSWSVSGIRVASVPAVVSLS